METTRLIGLLELMAAELRGRSEPVGDNVDLALSVVCDELGLGHLMHMRLAERTRLTFSHDGDRSVGIPGDQAELFIELDSYGGPDAEDVLQTLEEDVARSLGDVWGFKVVCVRDAVLRAQRATERSLDTEERFEKSGLQARCPDGRAWFLYDKDGRLLPRQPAEGFERRTDAVDAGLELAIAPVPRPRATGPSLG